MIGGRAGARLVTGAIVGGIILLLRRRTQAGHGGLAAFEAAPCFAEDHPPAAEPRGAG